jgi:hypothetical protein
VASVAIVSDQFVGLAKTVAKAKGLAALTLVVIPHPIGGLEPELVRNKAEKSIDLVISGLTG